MWRIFNDVKISISYKEHIYNNYNNNDYIIVWNKGNI